MQKFKADLITMNPPRCKSLDYTWNCFNGIGGSPVDDMCNSAGYDGNGGIYISQGTYTLNNNIHVQQQYQQIVIAGTGSRNTIFNHIIYNGNIAINCALECILP
eukprot:UN09328